MSCPHDLDALTQCRQCWRDGLGMTIVVFTYVAALFAVLFLIAVAVTLVKHLFLWAFSL